VGGRKMKKVDLKIALLLSLFCFVAGFFVVPYQMQALETYLSSSELKEMIGEQSIPIRILSLISSLQLFLISFVLAFGGIKLARKTGLAFPLLESIFEKGKKVTLHRKPFYLSVLFGGITGFLLIGSDKFYFQNQIPQLGETEPQFSLLGLVTGVLYGGVFEEVLLRLFLMSLLVWLFYKVFNRKNKNVPKWCYWISILLAAGLFAAGHLPATTMLFGDLTGMILFRCFLLNGVGGILFGYLYWKKGLEYSMTAHMFAHLSMQLLFIPLMY
jgi:membrane protease YdiL (CAAX protease family)